MNVRTIGMRRFRNALASVTVAMCAWSVVARAEESPAQGVDTFWDDDGLKVELNAQGLREVAELVRREVLAEPTEKDVPGVSKGLPGGIDLSVSGIKVGFSVSALSLKPKKGALRLEAELRNVKVHIDDMRLEKNVLGIPLRTSCANTEFLLGSGGSPVTLSSDIEAAVIDRKVYLGSRNTSFPVHAGNYRVRGPSACQGALIFNRVLTAAAHLAFSHAYPFIEHKVIAQVHKSLPKLGEKLTEQANISVTVDLHDRPPIPDRMITISAYPHRVVAKADSFAIVVGASFKDEERYAGRAALARQPLLNGRQLGTIGLNPHLLTSALNSVFENGTSEIEIDRNLVPQIREVLNIETAASIWPDLTTLAASENHLRVFARSATVPEITADEATQSVKIQIPRIELRFVVNQNGVWRDYFNMHLVVNSAIKASVEDGAITLAMLPGASLSVSGDWAAGYEPQIAVWEQDVATLVFTTLVDYLAQRGPLFQVKVPRISVGELAVTIDNPQVLAPFLQLDLVEAQ